MKLREAKIGMRVLTNHGNTATVVSVGHSGVHIIHTPRPKRYCANPDNLTPIRPLDYDALLDATFSAFAPCL